MRKSSAVILCVIVYTFASEIANQITTLVGYLNGGYELDSTARYLFSTVGPGGETIAVFSIPILLTIMLYLVRAKWNPAAKGRKQIQFWATIILVAVVVLLAINTTGAAISDYYTLHAAHLL